MSSRDGSHALQEPEQQVCPEVKANIFSIVTSSWLTNLLKLGYERPLNPSDLYLLDEKFRTEALVEQLDECWRERSSNPRAKWPLYWALSDAFGSKLYLSGILKFIGDSANMSSPFILRLLILNMATTETFASMWSESVASRERLKGYGLCLLLFAMQLLGNVVVNCYFTVNFRVGLRARTALNGLVFRKAQKLSGLARQEFSSGQMMNLISTDSTRIENSALFFHYVWSGPFQIIVILAILYKLIGVSVFVGFLMFIVFIPVQSKITTWLSTYRKVQNHTVHMHLTPFA